VSLQRAWSALESWVAEEEPVTWLALFRIAIGCIVVVDLIDTWSSGAMAMLWLPPDAGGLDELVGDWRTSLIGGPTTAAVYAWFFAALVGCAALIAGVGSRVGALLAGQALLALFALAPGTGGGHDRLLTNALWLLVLAPAGASLSLGCRLRTGRWTDPTPRAAWPRRLVGWQLVVMYTITGWQKLGPEWWPWGGLEAVYRSLLQPSWARWDLASVVAHLFPLTQAMTVATIVWEGSFPLLLAWWVGRRRGWRIGRWPVRGVLLGVGVVMHTTLWATSNLGPFPFVTLAFYLCCLDDGDWARLSSRLRGGTAPLR
jgi:hypothetical protein